VSSVEPSSQVNIAIARAKVAGAYQQISAQTIICPLVTALSYAVSTFTSGVAVRDIPATTPVLEPFGATFAISPALPAGLAIDSMMGTIYGHADAAAAAEEYTVTVSTNGGVASFAQNFAVSAAAPNAT
jgi:hypothetical protein